jgi:hypothetical protein
MISCQDLQKALLVTKQGYAYVKRNYKSLQLGFLVPSSSMHVSLEKVYPVMALRGDTLGFCTLCLGTLFLSSWDLRSYCSQLGGEPRGQILEGGICSQVNLRNRGDICVSIVHLGGFRNTKGMYEIQGKQQAKYIETTGRRSPSRVLHLTSV